MGNRFNHPVQKEFNPSMDLLTNITANSTDTMRAILTAAVRDNHTTSVNFATPVSLTSTERMGYNETGAAIYMVVRESHPF